MGDVVWPLSLEYDTVLSVMPVSEEAFDEGDTLFLEAVRKEAVLAA